MSGWGETITVVDSSNGGYSETVTQFFSYVIVPEPATLLLAGGGLFALGWVGRPRRP